MGQNHCQCAYMNTKITKVPKCSLLYQQMLAEYELPDKENYWQPLHSSRFFDTEPSKLPPKFTDLYMILRASQNKYSDSYFPACDWALGSAYEGQKWVRLSQKDINSSVLQENKLSTFCEVFKFLQLNFPTLCDNLRPRYVENVGFAVCELYILGQKREIIVDDQIPLCKFTKDVSGWVLLLEKAFAKAMGSYQYLEGFSVGEIFSEVTGIPYYYEGDQGTHQTSKQQWQKMQRNSFNTFSDALKCDGILYQTRRFSNDNSVFGYRKDFQIQNISFHAAVNHPTVIKIINPTKQILSLRVIQKNLKYGQNSDRPSLLEEYPCLHVELFMRKNGETLKKIFRTMRFHNNICKRIAILDVQNHFTELNMGTYWLYVQQLEESSKLNLITYCKVPVKISETFDAQASKKISFEHARVNYGLSQIQYTEVGKGVRASVNKFPDKVAILFEKNYHGKAMKLLNSSTHLIIEGEQLNKNKKIVNLGRVMGKWVLVLLAGNRIDQHSDLFEIVDV